MLQAKLCIFKIYTLFASIATKSAVSPRLNE